MNKLNPSQKFTDSNIQGMDERFRVNFVNSLSGFKSLQLVGTQSKAGRSNLAPISSAVHIGAKPALIGMILRPNTVARQTLENIMETQYWTLNNVRENYYTQAHQCAARYDDQTSEFAATNLSEFHGTIPVPYVNEASIKIGLKFMERIDIKANGTHMIIGKIIEAFIPQDALGDDGTIDLELAGSLTVAGLDSYHKTKRLARLSYAKVGSTPHAIL